MVLPIHSPEQIAAPAPSRAGETLLEAKGLRKAFGGQVVLDGVDVRLSAGEVVLLRGENGSGKTTLLNILTGNLQPDAGEIQYLADGTPRTFSFPRRWWQDLNPFDHFVPEAVAREGIGRTWQDVRLFGAQTLRENIVVAEPGHPGENPWTALIAPGRSARKEKQLRKDADAVLDRFGLAGREDSSADMISLGQSKRVAIARAVAAGAKILFLDEPLAGLDRQGIDDVLALLKSLVRDHTLTLVIVEHVFNQPHLRDLVTTDWLLKGGRLISDYASATRLTPNSAATSSMSTFKTQDSATSNPQSLINNIKIFLIYPKSEILRPSWFPLLAGEGAEIIDEPLPRGALLTRIRRPDRFKPGSPSVLEVRDLIVKRGPRVVISGGEQEAGGMNLSIKAGEIAILQAPNGWGKSSLMSALVGIIRHDSGTISVLGDKVDALRPWDRSAKGLASLPSAGAIFPSIRVKEAMQLAGQNTIGLLPETFGTRTCSSLSGGERQRLALSCLQPEGRQNPTVLLLDEPFAMLDEGAIRAAIEAILHIADASTIIFSPTSV